MAFPETLRGLTIEHCPLAKGFALVHLLRTAVRPLRGLESLKIRYMPRLSSRALDDVLFLLPQLKTLSVSVDYITPAIFDEGHYSHLAKEPLNTFVHTPSAFLEDEEAEAGGPPSLQHHALHTLELTSSGNTGIEDKISPIDLLMPAPSTRRSKAIQYDLHYEGEADTVDSEDDLKFTKTRPDDVRLLQNEAQPEQREMDEMMKDIRRLGKTSRFSARQYKRDGGLEAGSATLLPGSSSSGKQGKQRESSAMAGSLPNNAAEAEEMLQLVRAFYEQSGTSSYPACLMTLY